MTTFNYRMVKCSRCGASSALEYGICQRCGLELKKPTAGRNILLGIGAAVLIVGLLSLLMFLTRGTVVGAFLVLGIAVLSAIVSVASYIWLVVAAFQVSGMWGIAVIFVPLAQLALLYKYTDRAIMPIILYVFSLVLLFTASFALPETSPASGLIPF